MRLTEKTDTRRSAGFSLLELVVAASLGGVILAGAWNLFSGTTDCVALNVWKTGVDTSVRTVIERVKEDLKDSGEDPGGVGYVISHPISATTVLDYVQFRKRIAFDGLPTDWGTEIKYELVESQGENPLNGVDDDGDGVVDERTLVRTQDGESIPIAHDVTNIEFTRTAGNTGMAYFVDVTRTPKAGEALITVTRSMFVALRNVEQSSN